MKKSVLGKGLGALITSSNSENMETDNKELRINDIEPNSNQPRKFFDNEKLVQLSESIKQHGVVQPIIVKKENDTYRIIAGERRWRAARMAGLTSVPVVIKDVTSKQLMEMALIENIQREDLNAIEEAEAYDRLMRDFKLTQEEVSKTVGKSRPSVANALRLLGLCEEVKSMVINEQLSGGHARALIVLEDKNVQIKIAQEIIDKGLSVRETERLVKNYGKTKTKRETKNSEIYEDIENNLKNIFGTKVKLLPSNNKGKIMIEYYSRVELERILEMVNTIPSKD